MLVTLRDSPALLMPLSALVGLCVGIVGAVPHAMVHVFPPAVRFSGISTSYNVAYAVFGGLTPIAVTLMLQASPIAPAIYVLILGAVGVAAGLGLKRVRQYAV